jgi:hypothetical protein
LNDSSVSVAFKGIETSESLNGAEEEPVDVARRAAGAACTFSQEKEFLEEMASVWGRRIGPTRLAKELAGWGGFWRLRFRKWPTLCGEALDDLKLRSDNPLAFRTSPGAWMRNRFEWRCYFAGVIKTPPKTKSL